MIEPPSLYTPLKTPTLSSQGVISSTWQLMQGRLWPLIEKALCLGQDQYRAMGSFRVALLGKIVKIVISTNDKQDDVILQHARYGEKIEGGYGWDTFARICFGWENLIMTKGQKHAKLSRALAPLFNIKSVRDCYYKDLKAVTQTTVTSWSKEKQGIHLLDVALEHSCRSVTTCFLGKEAAESKAIVEAVRNLMGVFWDNAQIKPYALICQVWRKIFGRCCGDPDGYWHSHDVLEDAIEKARNSAPKESFIGRLGEQEFTHQELIDNMKMLYFAGTETTGSLITTLLGYLAINKDEQKKLLEELHNANVNALEDLDYEKLHKLSRLRAVLYESLRLVPPLPVQVRMVQTDRGSYSYFIDHYHRLRDRNHVGQNPNQFNPERFLDNGTLICDVEKTFGGGRTLCLGKHFAITETLLLIASIILQGSFELIEGDPTEVIREAGAHLSPNLKIRFI